MQCCSHRLSMRCGPLTPSGPADGSMRAEIVDEYTVCSANPTIHSRLVDSRVRRLGADGRRTVRGLRERVVAAAAEGGAARRRIGAAHLPHPAAGRAPGTLTQQYTDSRRHPSQSTSRAHTPRSQQRSRRPAARRRAWGHGVRLRHAEGGAGGRRAGLRRAR